MQVYQNLALHVRMKLCTLGKLFKSAPKSQIYVNWTSFWHSVVSGRVSLNILTIVDRYVVSIVFNNDFLCFCHDEIFLLTYKVLLK